MVAFMHTGTRLTAGYRYTTLGDATAAETRLPCFALFAARLSSMLQNINNSVFIADSSLVNCTLLRVALRSSLLNDSMEFVV